MNPRSNEIVENLIHAVLTKETSKINKLKENLDRHDLSYSAEVFLIGCGILEPTKQLTRQMKKRYQQFSDIVFGIFSDDEDFALAMILGEKDWTFDFLLAVEKNYRKRRETMLEIYKFTKETYTRPPTRRRKNPKGRASPNIKTIPKITDDGPAITLICNIDFLSELLNRNFGTINWSKLTLKTRKNMIKSSKDLINKLEQIGKELNGNENKKRNIRK